MRALAYDVDATKVALALQRVHAMTALFETVEPTIGRAPNDQGEAHHVGSRCRTMGHMQVVLRDGMTVLRIKPTGEQTWTSILNMDQIEGTCGAGEGDPVASALIHLSTAEAMLQAPAVDDPLKTIREALAIAHLFGVRSAAKMGWLGKAGSLMRPSSVFGPASGIARRDEVGTADDAYMHAEPELLSRLDEVASGVFEIRGMLPTLNLTPWNVHTRFETDGPLDLMRELRRAESADSPPMALIAA